jgi:copper homeostasis protein
METLIGLGVARIMTSGQEESAYNGAGVIAELIRRAGGRIEILPAGGINRFTLADVVERTGCDQVHASLKAMKPDRSTSHHPKIGFGGVLRPPEGRFEATDRASVEEMRRRIDGG